MQVLTDQMLKKALPLFNMLAVILLVIGLATILMVGKDVLLPLALAVLLSFVLSPVTSKLQQWGLNRGLAVMGTLVFATSVIVLTGFIMFQQFTGFAMQLPHYKATIIAKTQSLSQGAGSGGSLSQTVEAISSLLRDLQSASNDSAVAPASKPVAVMVQKEPSSAFSTLGNLLTPVLHPLVNVVSVFLLVGFLLGAREDLRNRVIRLMGTADIQQTTALINDAGQRVSRMLLMQLVVNASFALVIGAGLWLIGLPNAFLWGLLAGISRFIPYIGAVIGLVPPLLVAFAVDPTWQSTILTALLFGLIEPVIGHVIEPLLYGRSTGLSPVAIVICTMIWAYLWGPIGLVLATPLTICLVVTGRHLGGLQFLDILLGDRPALLPHEIFYQRMLARDPMEARQQARAFVRSHSLAAYYDVVALEALRRAHLDIVRGNVQGERLVDLLGTTANLINSLSHVKETVTRRTWRPKRDAETAAALEIAHQEQAHILPFFAKAHLPLAWQVQTPVLVLHGDHPLDQAAATMLAQVFSRLGLQGQVLPVREADQHNTQAAKDLQLVCLSFIEPLSTLHLRALSLAVHRHVPKAKIILCIWQEMEKPLITALARKLRVEGVATTISSAYKIAYHMVEADKNAEKKKDDGAS